MKHDIFLNFSHNGKSYEVLIRTVTGTPEVARAWTEGYIDCMRDHGKWAHYGFGKAVNIEDNALSGVVYSFRIETD